MEKSSNFHVIAGCIVRKVIIEYAVLILLRNFSFKAYSRHGRATGVEYFYNQRIRGAGVDSGPRTVRAKKLVVVSAGAIGSPAILERSGIGARDVLERNGIAQIVDLPGVGDNYNGGRLSLGFPRYHYIELTLLLLQITGFCLSHSTLKRTRKRWTVS